MKPQGGVEQNQWKLATVRIETAPTHEHQHESSGSFEGPHNFYERDEGESEGRAGGR